MCGAARPQVSGWIAGWSVALGRAASNSPDNSTKRRRERTDCRGARTLRCRRVLLAPAGDKFRSAWQRTWSNLINERKQSTRVGEIYYTTYHVSHDLCIKAQAPQRHQILQNEARYSSERGRVARKSVSALSSDSLSEPWRHHRRLRERQRWGFRRIRFPTFRCKPAPAAELSSSTPGFGRTAPKIDRCASHLPLRPPTWQGRPKHPGDVDLGPLQSRSGVIQGQEARFGGGVGGQVRARVDAGLVWRRPRVHFGSIRFPCEVRPMQGPHVGPCGVAAR